MYLNQQRPRGLVRKPLVYQPPSEDKESATSNERDCAASRASTLNRSIISASQRSSVSEQKPRSSKQRFLTAKRESDSQPNPTRTKMWIPRDSLSGEERQRNIDEIMVVRKMTDSQMDNIIEDSKNGVLKESLLSRRRMTGTEVYFPDINHKTYSYRGNESIPSWLEYTQGRRLLYDKVLTDDQLLQRTGMLKENLEDKIVTFYRDFQSTKPEIRLVVSESRFRDFYHLISDLSKIVNLRDNEKYIHTPRGHIVRRLSEFEDGGVYFFGPPHIYNVDDYNCFRQANTPELIDSEDDEIEREQRTNRYSPSFDDYNKYWKNSKRRRNIKIISNVTSKTCPFVVDETHHRAMREVLQDISDLILPKGGCVEKLCTRKGRTIQSIGELFFEQDDCFVAIYSQMNEYDTVGNSYYYRRGLGPKKLSYVTSYERATLSKPVQVNINGKVHTFDAPSYDDGLYLRQTEPTQEMELEWIYGYNGKTCRNNVFLLPSEEIVYFVGKVVIIYKVEEHQQRFYLEHTDEIRCITQHPNQWILATGQISGGEADDMSHVKIWDSKSLMTLNVLSLDEMSLSVECLAYSQMDNGIKLAIIATTGDEWTFQIWDWEELNILSKSESYNAIELSCMFDPVDNNTVISVGKNHVFFWNILGDEATYNVGTFYDYPVPDYVTCIGFSSQNTLITADSNAFVHLWETSEQKTTTLVKTNHTGSIITMQVLPDDNIITGGGSDRMLTLIKYDELEPTVSETQISQQFGGIVAMAPIKSGFISNDYSSLKLILGTSMNIILCGSIDTGFETMVTGTSGQMSAMVTHPVDNTFISAGEDSCITLWNAEQHEPVWEKHMHFPCTAIAFHPACNIVAVGSERGECYIFNSVDAQQIHSLKCDHSRITCISYSPQGNAVVMGTESGAVHFYHCYVDGRNYRYVTDAKAQQDEIISIDWTLNGTHICYTTTNNDIHYWQVDRRCEETNRHIIRDLQLPKQNTALSYNTAGVWDSEEKDMFYTCANRSNNSAMFCTGNNQGVIRLYNYPCGGFSAPYNAVNFHIGSVSSAVFLSRDLGIVSSGQNDYCLIQWKLVKKEPTKTSRIQTRTSILYNMDRSYLAQSDPRLGNSRYVSRRLSSQDLKTSQDGKQSTESQDRRPITPPPLNKPVDKQSNGAMLSRPSRKVTRPSENNDSARRKRSDDMKKKIEKQ